nr:hypothetical protein [Tanacetum cinerariifolium]
CDSSLDSSRCGEDSEQWWGTIHWRENIFKEGERKEQRRRSPSQASSCSASVFSRLGAKRQKQRRKDARELIRIYVTCSSERQRENKREYQKREREDSRDEPLESKDSIEGRHWKRQSRKDQVGERVIEGPEMIEVTNEKVAVAKEKLKEARTLSPARGVRRFGIKGKLSPRFIGPLESLDRVGEVSYRLALPPQLSHVHNVFHVSLLRGYKYHPLHVISYPLDQIRADLSYVEEPEAILDRQDRVMRNKTIPFVKILWRNHLEREATWETEERHGDQAYRCICRIQARRKSNEQPLPSEGRNNAVVFKQSKRFDSTFQIILSHTSTKKPKQKGRRSKQDGFREFCPFNKKVLVEIMSCKSIEGIEVMAIVEEEGNIWMTSIKEYIENGTLPEEKWKEWRLRAKLNKYVILEGTLYRKSFLGPWLRCIDPEQASYVIREITKAPTVCIQAPDRS